jgi:hypothetical protein
MFDQLFLELVFEGLKDISWTYLDIISDVAQQLQLSESCTLETTSKSKHGS